MGTYWQKLRDPRWQRRRLEILQRDSFRCRLCYDASSTLHVHHLRYERDVEPWEAADLSLIALCETCHEEMHSMQFGPSIVEALISGGADMMLLLEFEQAIDALFIGGPDAGKLSSRTFSSKIREMYELFAAALRAENG